MAPGPLAPPSYGAAVTAPDAASTYQSLVAEIIDGRQAGVPYPPGAPVLSITRRHRPATPVDLDPAELAQLTAVWRSEGGATLAEILADEEHQIEAAEVHDEAGVLRYRLYGWNYGVGFLFPPTGLDVVAFGAQHDIEHWSVEQRDLFAGMDRALRAGGHGFTQPLHFCWADDTCWDRVAGAEPHSLGSEPYLRRTLGAA